MKLERDQ